MSRPEPTGKAMALAMGTHWICNFVIGQLFLAAVDRFSVPLLYSFFGLVCLISARFAASIHAQPSAAVASADDNDDPEAVVA